MRNAKTLFTAALTVGLLMSRAARADLAPPDTIGCHGKNIGDACQTDKGVAGVCSPYTCGHAYPDGSTSSYSCPQCVPSDAAVPDMEAGAAGNAGAAGSAAVTPSPTPSASGDSSGCAVGGFTSTKAFGPWMLAGCVSALLFLIGRRRRQ